MIVVVEDEACLAALLKQGLPEEGHAVDLSGDGEALEWVDVGEYAALVFDVMLPGIDGLEVCQRLRQQRGKPPILLLTARDPGRKANSQPPTAAHNLTSTSFPLHRLVPRTSK